MSPIIRFCFCGIFIVAALLRLSLCYVNREANDGHFEVISRILEEKRLPGREECDQCYQPKLYHAAAAQFIRLLAIKSTAARIITAQMLSGLAGIVVLLLSLLLIVRLPGVNHWTGLFVFAMLAFNPALIAINGQCTNDSFVILFGTLAFFLMGLFQEKNKWLMVTALTLSTIVAGISKGDGLPLFIVVLAVLSVRVYVAVHGKKIGRSFLQRIVSRPVVGKLAQLLFFIVLYMWIVPSIGGYTGNGSRFSAATNIAAIPDRPPLIKENFMSGVWPERAGVSSVVHAYATFRFVDLLRHPLLLWWEKAYPRHRTSLWTELYGNAFFAQFECWPPSWIMTNWYIPDLGRTLFVLSLLPLFFLIVGIFMYCNRLYRFIATRGLTGHLTSLEWVLPFGALLYLVFIIAYTWLYRDYSTMKPIFIYPAILCFVKLMLDGMTFVAGKSKRLFVVGIYPLLTVLSALYVVDIGTLIRHIWISVR
jgi:hypothetical protein